MTTLIPHISIDSSEDVIVSDTSEAQRGIENILINSSPAGSVTSLFSSDLLLSPTEKDAVSLPRSPILRRGRISAEKEIEDIESPKKGTMSKIEFMKKIFSFNSKNKRGEDCLSPEDTGSNSTIGSIKNSQSSLRATSNNRSNNSLFKNIGRRLSFTNEPVAKMNNLDEYITKLQNCANGDKFPFTSDEVKSLCRDAKDLVASQPILLELNSPINICGDIHGQYKDLLEIFKISGDPGTNNYLFLGDYVDRGQQSLETMLLMICYKLKYPDTFFLLRGNHECSNINRVYGFFDECKRKLNSKIWKCFTDFFDYLPLAAIVGNRVFCVHGGISPFLKSLDDIRRTERPLHIERTGLQTDLLWSDPSETAKCWEENGERGISYFFGTPQVDAFLEKFDFDLIVRAHMVVEGGYEFFNNKTLVTIFSAPNYCGHFDNLGGILCIDQNLTASFKFVTAKTYKTVEKF